MKNHNLIYALILFIFIHEIVSEDEDICPHVASLGDMSDENTKNTIQLEIMEKMWDKLTHLLTNKGNDLKDAILNLARSDVQIWRDSALGGSVWIWSYLPYYEYKPSLCPFANLINATVAWKKYDDCQILVKAQNLLARNTPEASKFFLDATLKNCECKNYTEKIKPKKFKCYANGTVYFAKHLWKLMGPKYPYQYQKAALNLYGSDVYEDQLLGALATLSISEPYLSSMRNFDYNLLFQILTMGMCPKIPPHCCDEFKKELKELHAPLQCKSLQAVEDSKNDTNCLDC